MFPGVKTLKTLQKRLFQVLVFLLPTQLALHFWPDWAFIFGIRVDYLSPAIYLTDLLVLLLIGLWFLERRTIFVKRRWLVPLILLVTFVVINLFVSLRPEPAFYKWVKYFVFILFALFISKVKSFNFDNWIGKPLKLSLIFISTLGILQFIFQQTLGGPLYYLGERSFTSLTPGVALSTFLGRQYLRSYSVFSHPNSFAGFLLVALILLYFKRRKLGKVDYLVLTISLTGLLLTFSKTVVAMVVTLFIVRAVTKKELRFSEGFKHTLLIVAVVISVLAPVVAESDLRFISSSETVEKRVVLAKAAGEMVSQRPLFGVGLNNFVIALPTTSLKTEHSWDLQPVHNLFLLVLAEAGIVGLILFFFAGRKLISIQDEKVFVSFVAIMLTGLADHYWLTLQQNLLLLFLLVGLSFRTKKSKFQL